MIAQKESRFIYQPSVALFGVQGGRIKVRASLSYSILAQDTFAGMNRKKTTILFCLQSKKCTFVAYGKYGIEFKMTEQPKSPRK